MRYALLPIGLTVAFILLVGSGNLTNAADGIARLLREHPVPVFFLSFGAYLLLLFLGKGPFSRRWLTLTEPTWQVDLYAPLESTKKRRRPAAKQTRRRAARGETKAKSRR